MKKDNSSRLRHISRRDFLAGAAATAAGLLAGCRQTAQPIPTSTSEPVVGPISTNTPLPPTYTPTSSPTLTPTSTATQMPVELPTATATNLPTATSTPAPTAAPVNTPTTIPTPAAAYQVAIAQATSYDRSLIRQQVETMFDGLGGLEDVIKPGDRVAIKVNLTGGASWKLPGGAPLTEVYFTHPEVVRALGELLRDAGAGQIFIVEAFWDQASYTSLGYAEVAQALNATLVNLNEVQPYSDFAATPVGPDPIIYQNFVFNHILEEIDVFVSVAKMKCHYNCGVTHAMKNLIGLVPLQHYQSAPTDSFRSAMHGPDAETGGRLPGVILDLNRARPIHLAVIDGVKTAEGGEGPWQQTFAPVEPGVLIAGKNAVSTDAVATAVMGFDPTAASYTKPFTRCDNYLNMAYERGLGSNRLNDIEVVGASINEVRYEFQPA